jgi:NADP-dependent 3-hydroxy acid dehydrogenase YdfG
MLNVENKVVIITGASSGIGEATAKLLAKNGAKVVLGAQRIDSHSERLRQRLETIAKEIHADGGIAEYQALDVTQRSQLTAIVQFAKDKFDRVDVIFNNAGVMPLFLLNVLKVDEWDKMINVNIHGVLNGIAAVLPIMEAQGGGQIINNASIAAHMVGATKHAVWAISDGLRQESKNIRVTIISPGMPTVVAKNSSVAILPIAIYAILRWRGSANDWYSPPSAAFTAANLATRILVATVGITSTVPWKDRYAASIPTM